MQYVLQKTIHSGGLRKHIVDDFSYILVYSNLKCAF